VLDVRVDHGAQRVVLQVRELRHDEWVCVGRRFKVQGSGFRVHVAGWHAGAPQRPSAKAGASRPFVCSTHPAKLPHGYSTRTGSSLIPAKLLTGGQEPGNRGCLYLSRIER